MCTMSGRASRVGVVPQYARKGAWRGWHLSVKTSNSTLDYVDALW